MNEEVCKEALIDAQNRLINNLNRQIAAQNLLIKSLEGDMEAIQKIIDSVLKESSLYVAQKMKEFAKND